MKFIYVLTVLFFIGCQSQPPMSSAGKIDEIEKTLNQLTNNQQASDDVSMSSAGKIDEIEKTLKHLTDNQQENDDTSMSSAGKIDEIEKTLKHLTDNQQANDGAPMSSADKDKIDEIEKTLKHLVDNQQANDDASMLSINKMEQQLKELIKNIKPVIRKPDERLKAYKATYDGYMEYINGYYKEDVVSAKKAIEYFKKALKLQKNNEIYGERKNPIIPINKGYGYGKTISDYEQFTANTELSYYLYLTIGKSYYSLCLTDNEDYCQDAIDNFDEAINILEKNEYNYPDPYYHKGLAYMSHKNVKEAKKNFDKAIKIHNKGKKYFKERIIREELSSSEYRKYIKNKKYRKYIKNKKKDKLFDSEFRVHIALAISHSERFVDRLYKNGKPNDNTRRWLKETKKEYLKVLSIDPEHDTAFHNLGETEYRLGKYKNAIKETNKALFINPTDAASYFNKGLSLLKLKKYNSACFNFSIAETLDYKYIKNKEEVYKQIKKDAKCF